MTPTTTAATPEELARTADMRASLDRAYAIASPTGAANHLAAWANNHGKALLDLAEAQRAEIERLTKELSATGYALVRACKRINDLDDKGDTHWNVRRLMLRCAIRYRTRATAAEAALAEMNPANPDWREVAMSNGKALGERNAAWDRLNEELAAVTAERDRMREALERIADPGGRKSRGLGFHEMKGTARAALSAKEATDER